MPEPPSICRLFIAVPIPAPVRQAIAGIQRELRASQAGEGLRWSPPEQFHLTLRFLGDVEGAQVDALTGVLQKTCAESAGFELYAEGLGFFPDARNPRVIWVGLASEHRALETLWRRIQDASCPFTREPVEHRFSGHVTLGRIKFLPPRDRTTLVELANRFAKRSFGTWRADRVDLMRSELSAAGARHTCLASCSLGKP